MALNLRQIALLATVLLVVSACKSTPSQRDKTAAEQARLAAIKRASPAATQAAIGHAMTGRDLALDTATDRAVGWRQLPAEQLSWKSILDPDRAPDGSFSSGTVSNGVLLDSAELPKKGEFHSIIERHQRHRTRWGTRELVDLIQKAAQHVYTMEGGAPLRVGNVSKKKGGDIRWSRSHNSGRDADLAFYVVDATTGESVKAPDLLRFDDKGVPGGREDLRFDVGRNWRLVEGLLAQTDVNVQWLFISIPLKEMLLAHGRSINADPKVIERASEVLHQPTDAPPHADHFHLRIGCSRDDRLDGCLDYGPQWAWLDWHQHALLARSLQVAKAFEEGERDDRRRAVEFLGEIKSPYAADIAGVWGFWDADIRDVALAVADAQYGWSANALVQVQKLISVGGPTPRQLRTAYQILRRSRDELSRDFAVSRLSDTTLDPAERAHAAGALGHFMDPGLVKVLLANLEDPAPEVRSATAEVLRRITNRSEGIDWATSTPEEASEARQRWESWHAENETAPRDLWLARGFRALGVKLTDSVEPHHIDALVPLLESEDSYVRYNANRTIREITGRWAPLEQDDGKALTKYWKKWWNKNRDRVISGEIGGDA